MLRGTGQQKYIYLLGHLHGLSPQPSNGLSAYTGTFLGTDLKPKQK